MAVTTVSDMGESTCGSLCLTLSTLLMLLVRPSKGFIQNDTEIVIFMVSNFEDDRLAVAKEAALQRGFKFEHIRLSTRTYRHGYKLKALQYASCEMAPNDIFVFLDARDVLIAGQASVLRQKLADIAAKSKSNQFLLFNAEKECFPYPELSGKFPESISPWKYLNSGGIVGVAGSMCKILREANIQDEHDIMDQAWWMEYFLRKAYDPLLMLDYSCVVFQTLHFYKEGELVKTDLGFLNPITGSMPIFVHGNGYGKELVGKLALEYDQPLIINESR